MAFYCYKCGEELYLGERVGRQETCPKCSAYLRCCKNCEFFDPLASNHCREPQSEPVTDPEMANFCDFFKFKKGQAQSLDDKKAKAKEAWEALFKK